QKYKFLYNVYGEIAKVELPTGGYYRYEYTALPGLDGSFAAELYQQGNRGVIRQFISATGAAGDEKQWTYTTLVTSSYRVTVSAPDNSRIERYLHPGGTLGSYGYQPAQAGRAF